MQLNLVLSSLALVHAYLPSTVNKKRKNAKHIKLQLNPSFNILKQKFKYFTNAYKHGSKIDKLLFHKYDT